MMFLIVVLTLMLIALSLYASGIFPAYTTFVDAHLLGVPATTPAMAAQTQTTSPVVPTSTVLPISPTSCMAAVDCKAASQLALQHYTSVTGAPQGTTISRVVGSSDPTVCSFAFDVPGSRTVTVDLLGRKTNLQVPIPADERRLVFTRDSKSCAPTGVTDMGGPGSGFMVHNLIPGTLSLGGMCAVPRDGRTSAGIPVEFQPCDAYSPAQLWAFDPSTGQLQPQADRSYCLDVANVSRNNGAKVQLWSCNETAGQVWSYDETKGEVRSGIRPGFCLDAPGANSSKGTQLGVWDCNGVVAAQRFATALFH